VVNHIHDVSFCAYPHLIGQKDLFFLNLLIPRSLRRSDAIVTPSVFTKNEIMKYYGTDETKIHVIYNALGSDFLIHRGSGLSNETLREKYQLPEAYMLYVGTLQPRKNIPFLLQAFSELQTKVPAMKLVLVGNKAGHHFDGEIDKTIARLQLEEEVIFPGYVAAEDLTDVYRMAEVFVFPSLYEGFGIPLLEAMSMEIPVVASDQPCLKEIGGEAALYFELGNVDSLVQILYSLKATPGQKDALVEKGKARIQDFSWQKSGAALKMLYQTLGAEIRK
jgi:glycosyltransferase involved in cell wall biosynthesis